MKLTSPSRRGVRSCSRLVLWAGILGWLASHVVHVTWYGDELSFCFGNGCAALYWGDDAEHRNSMVLNGYSWPAFSHGAGANWSENQWGRWHGSMLTLSQQSLRQLIEYPKNLGVYTPGLSFTSNPSYFGMPFWFVACLGAPGAILTRNRVRPGHCRKCRYDLRGNITGLCPECGNAVSNPS